VGITYPGAFVPLPRGILILGSSGAASAVSSGTAETQLASVAVPAGWMGKNGSLRITTLWSYTNSANTKTLRVRFGGSGGAIYQGLAITTTATSYMQCWIRNNNSASAQKAYNVSLGVFASTTSALATSAIDTAASTTVYISGKTASDGETITLEGYTVELIPGVL